MIDGDASEVTWRFRNTFSSLDLISVTPTAAVGVFEVTGVGGGDDGCDSLERFMALSLTTK